MLEGIKLLLTTPETERLPKVELPVVLNVPAMFAPVPVTVNMFALPATLVVTLPLVTIATLLVPFAIVENDNG